MLLDRVSNPGPPTYESGALPIALHGPALLGWVAILLEKNLPSLICFPQPVPLCDSELGCPQCGGQ